MLEDSELELMEAYDKGLAAVAEAQKELAVFQDKARHKKADLEKRSSVVSADLITAEQKQAEAEKLVPEDVLPRYRRILKSKKDVAIVPIRGGACGGCHMKLTPNTVISAPRRRTPRLLRQLWPPRLLAGGVANGCFPSLREKSATAAQKK